MPDVDVIEYRLTSGERGRIDVKAVSHVSVLSDGRGVIGRGERFPGMECAYDGVTQLGHAGYGVNRPRPHSREGVISDGGWRARLGGIAGRGAIHRRGARQRRF